MNLSDVSRTAILTLLGHVNASEKKNIVFDDPMAALCLERLMSIASAQEKKWIIRQKRLIATPDARALARRVETFDTIVNLFISNNPKCTVINLACGFDTRFWRIENKDCRYIEIDFPEVVALKREILKDQLSYELIGCSVLDPLWIDQVTTNGNSNFLLLAEGLFMFLSKQDVINLLNLLAQKFIRSQLVVEMAHEKYTKGFWKMIFALQARVWGLDVSFAFGIKNPGDIESYGHGLRVLGDVKGSAVGPIIILSINAL
jgi:O-methyltransferase involved in polyketide biosynthesis